MISASMAATAGIDYGKMPYIFRSNLNKFSNMLNIFHQVLLLGNVSSTQQPPVPRQHSESVKHPSKRRWVKKFE